jgi:hypothetical protein
MKRILPLLLLPVACWAVTANADERTFDANNVEALTLALSHLGADLQSRDTAGAPVHNRLTGPQIEFGYANTRTRAVFGVPGFYTRLELSLGFSRQDFSGGFTDPSTGVLASTKGPFDALAEAARGRIGYGWEFGPDRRLAATPYLGLAQQSWLRSATAVSGTAAYFHEAVEAGLLLQTSVAREYVLGADASVGRVLGAWQIDHRNLLGPQGRIATSISLYLDHRTDADSHERIFVRQGSYRFGEPAQTTGSLEPRRNSAFTIGLEFGTEGNLLEALFH